MFSPKIAVGTNGSVIHHKQVNAEKVKRERTVNDWWKAPHFPRRKPKKASGYNTSNVLSSSSIMDTTWERGLVLITKGLWVDGTMEKSVTWVVRIGHRCAQCIRFHCKGRGWRHSCKWEKDWSVGAGRQYRKYSPPRSLRRTLCWYRLDWRNARHYWSLCGKYAHSPLFPGNHLYFRGQTPFYHWKDFLTLQMKKNPHHPCCHFELRNSLVFSFDF